MDESPKPKYSLPPSMVTGAQVKPLTKMLTQMMPKKLKLRLIGRGTRGKITTGDIKVTHKKIKYW